MATWSGRPRRLLAPAPLQIRTCGITASGSSNHGICCIGSPDPLFVDVTFTQNCSSAMSRCVSFRRVRDSALRFPPLAPAGGSSPASQVLPERSDFPPSIPPRSLSFARRYHALLLVVRQRGVAVAGSSSELRRCLDPLPSAHTRGDMRDLPGSSATPLRTCPALRPRRTGRVRPLATHPILPSAQLTASAPLSVTFRGSMTRPAHSLSTLHGPDCSNTAQDSLPAGGQPWRDRTLTCRVASGGFLSVSSTHIVFPSSRLFLAHQPA